MGILRWFRSIAEGASPPEAPPPAPPPAAQADAEVHGLNFMSAIDAHLRWKNRLEDYIDGRGGEELHVESVSRDDRCELGRWIYGEGGLHLGHLLEFEELREQHAEFHSCAGKVLAVAKSGNRQAAHAMLREGEYVRTSGRIKLALAKLFIRVRGPEHPDRR